MTRDNAMVWLDQYVEKGYCSGAFADAINTAISALRELETGVKPGSVKTNGDHIRSMTDVELKGLLGYNSLCDHIQDENPRHCGKYGACHDCIPDWLKQPYGGDT